jgi:O-antigen ligase
VPSGFGVWVLFLLWVGASSLLATSPSLTVVFRASMYLSATVFFVYVLNSGREVASRAIVFTLAAFWLIVVVGGYLGLLFPRAEITSLAERILPARIASIDYVAGLIHPRFAQASTFLGFESPRPSAPFEFSNQWGSTFTLLAPSVLAAYTLARSTLVRQLLVLALIVSVVPFVIGVNRGAWISLAAGAGYAMWRLATKGNLRALGALVTVTGLVAVLLLTTELGGFVERRIEEPHSNEGRLILYQEATRNALESPLIGYGGPLPPPPGRLLPPVGTHGQLWLVLVAQGFPGAALFAAWLFYAFWRSRTPGSPVRFWMHVTLFMALLQLPVYSFMPAQLHLIMVAAALAWRETLFPPHGSRPVAPPVSGALSGRRPEDALVSSSSPRGGAAPPG